MSIARIEKFVLSLLIFSIPFGTGIIYSAVVKEDLIFMTDVLLGVLYLLWFARSRKTPFEFGKLALPGILVIIWSLVSMVNAIALQASAIGIFFSVKALLLYLYLVNNLKNREHLVSVINALVLSIMFQAFVGLFQKFAGRPLGLYFLGESAAYSYSWRVARIRGTIGFPNQYAAFLVMIMPLAIALAFFVKKRGLRIFYVAASMFSIMALFFSLSRSAWAGFLLGLICFALLLARRNLLKPSYIAGFVGICVVMAVIVALKWSTIEARMETGSTGIHRQHMIQIAWSFIVENPVTGVGLNNYEWHNQRYFNFWQPVHNEFLRFASETGVPGFVFFFWLIIAFFRQSYKLVLNRDTLWTLIGISGFCGLMAFLVTINIGPQYQHYRIQQAFWTMGGLVCGAEGLRKKERQKKHKEKRSESRRMRNNVQVHPATPPPPQSTMVQRRESNENTDDRQVFLRKGWS